MTKQDGAPQLVGLVPDRLQVRSARILLEDFEVQADIGFHDFEVGSPQRLLVTVEVWLEDWSLPPEDRPEGAWNYDVLRAAVAELAGARRYNLQETLAHAIFDRVASARGVQDLRVRTCKPDVYKEARGVAIEIASFRGAWPNA